MVDHAYLIMCWNTSPDFLKIQSHYEAALETEQRHFSKHILESIVTPKSQYNKIIKLLQYSPIVNVGDWGCIVCDLETIIVLVLVQ